MEKGDEGECRGDKWGTVAATEEANWYGCVGAGRLNGALSAILHCATSERGRLAVSCRSTVCLPACKTELSDGALTLNLPVVSSLTAA